MIKLAGGNIKAGSSVNAPAPCIMAGGIGGVGHGQYCLTPETSHKALASGKPPYRVPLMAELAAAKQTGLKVASTFSGCGGSCLGYRMTGFNVIWANEFVPAAQACYRANFPTTTLDCRDVKTVQPEEVLEACGLKVNELDLLDGSPPCQAFSTAGKREKGWGKDRSYEHGAAQKNETLFDEFIRLLSGIQPKVFVAENVSGLVKGVAKGFFIDILKRLKSAGYAVECRLLDAQWLGVPQQRQRIIFIGVRNDLVEEFHIKPVFPKPFSYRYSVAEACPWIGRTWEETGGQFSYGEFTGKPSPTVRSGGTGHLKAEAKAFSVQSGAAPKYFRSSKNPSPAIMASRTAEMRRLPASRCKPDAFNLSLVDPKRPCATVTVGSPGNDLGVPISGRTERRKFTIGELKRICAFPDDFILTGSYAQQWERLGNAVPPLMMRAIAQALLDGIFAKISHHKP